MNSTTEVDERIAGDRKEIDELDSRIIELLDRRAQVSARIQRRRMDAGGPRTVLAREMAVLGRYRERLGSAGTAVAMNVLELCRGAAPRPCGARLPVDTVQVPGGQL